MSTNIEKMYKESLELHSPGDGRLFLNFWDWAHGDDVIVEIINDKLMLRQRDENADELPSKEITFTEFLKLVKESIESRKI